MVITVMIICGKQSFCPPGPQQKTFDSTVDELTEKIKSLAEALKTAIQKIKDTNTQNEKTNQENKQKVEDLKKKIASFNQGDASILIKEVSTDYSDEEPFVTPPASPQSSPRQENLKNSVSPALPPPGSSGSRDEKKPATARGVLRSQDASLRRAQSSSSPY